MKTNLNLMALMLLSAATAAAQNRPASFILKGKLTQHADSVILTYKNAEDKVVNDAKPVIGNQFTFTGTINKIYSSRILFKNKDEVIPQKEYWNRIKEIYLAPGQLTLLADPSRPESLKLTGSVTQTELDELNESIKPIRVQMKPITDALSQEKDHEKASEIRDQLSPFNDRIKQISYNFFISHPNSYVTLDMMRIYASRMKIDSVKRIYSNLSPALQETEPGKFLAAEIKKISAGLPGNTAAPFTTTDIAGKPLSLADFKGKYIIIDFWASWCVPCRKGNPHLIQVYNHYKDKGLTIIGISDDDRNHNAWKNAVTQDGIGIWHHVLRGLDMKLRMSNLPNPGDIAEKYGINSLPTKILIDPSGKIIGRYGDNNGQTDEDLDTQLAALLK